MSVFAKLVRRPFAVAAGAAVVAVLAQLSTGPATAVSTALAAATSEDPYGAAVRADGASIYWRLNESGGGVVANEITGAANSGNYSSGVVVGEPGSPAAPTGTSFRFPGTSTQNVISNVPVVNPTVYSVETWFKTTTTSGGRLIGFGNSPTINSSNYDRHIYMLDDGRLRYGIYTGQNSYMTSPLSYNDGAWHHVVATQGPGGGRLYVDGVQVGSGSAVTPEVYTGYWRLGTDKVWGNSTSTNFAGTLDEAAVYPSVLSAAAVANHYRLGTTPPNAAPTASFTATPDDLRVAFDGTGSSDPDGTIASYSWDFGDGRSGTGAQPSHTYAASGSYTVVLTVTDNRGASGTASVIVTVTDPILALDQFERTVASGLGTADRGGEWAYTGAGTTASVLNGASQVTVEATRNALVQLPDVTNLNTELNHVVWSVGAPNGGGIFVGSNVRVTAAGNYRARLRLTTTGSVTAQFVRAVGVSDALIGSAATVSGVNYTAGMRLRVRTQALGAAPTTLRTKVWVDGTPEPSAWTLSVTDSTAGYQTAGSIGLWAYASGTSSTATVRFDDLSAVIVPAAD